MGRLERKDNLQDRRRRRNGRVVLDLGLDETSVSGRGEAVGRRRVGRADRGEPVDKNTDVVGAVDGKRDVLQTKSGLETAVSTDTLEGGGGGGKKRNRVEDTPDDLGDLSISQDIPDTIAGEDKELVLGAFRTVDVDVRFCGKGRVEMEITDGSGECDRSKTLTLAEEFVEPVVPSSVHIGHHKAIVLSDP